ncbi:uncharacterized protein LOC108116186 [Drosophila eugracilis]|uniref:uncharacterized protein LOC108116186 n=1 Tax=Drosophila eugracilis TaxID=29029 RepID=UPI0007E6A005|nr:uncharacterized protein LOC108116186 [Drosophila eugracilis]
MIHAAGEISWWSCLRRSGWPCAIAKFSDTKIYVYIPPCPQTWPDKRRYYLFLAGLFQVIISDFPSYSLSDLTNHSTNRLTKYRHLTLERSLFNRLSTEMTAFGVTKPNQ